MTAPWDNDAEFEDSLITKVEGDNGSGWSITKTDGWSFWVPADSPVVPLVDMPIRMYGRGIGSPVRGLFLDGQCVFYRTEEEQSEYFAIQQYGKDAADVLSRWDEGRSVWSISMGGFGPGYEQALQIATFEVLRHLLAGNPIETAESLLDGLGYLGLSGAQWGAAKMLGNAFSIKTPRQMHEDYPRDRHIQVRKNFPSPLTTKLAEAAVALVAAKQSTFKAKNGRDVGIEDDSGEKMWIVPFDEMFALEELLKEAKS